MTIAVASCLSTAVSADITSPNPTPDHPQGWRGDGTGRYPNASAPVTWERRMITPLAELRSIAGKAADGAPAGGEFMRRAKGTFQPIEWLVLAPIAAPAAERDENKTLDAPANVDEARVMPVAGDRVGDLAWKPVRITRGVDLFTLLGPVEGNHVAYLFASVFAPRAADFGFRCEGNHGNWRFHLNGKLENGWDQAHHHLNVGWNRLLLKVVLRSRESNSGIEPELYPFTGPELTYATKNIAWTQPTPGPSYAMPLIVGDKLFVTSEPNDLICLDKRTGKLLWMRSDTLWQAAVDSELPSPPTLELVGVSDRSLTFATKSSLDPGVATSVASYQIEGATVTKAELSPHGTTVRLISDAPWRWNVGETAKVRVDLKTTSGTAIESPVTFTFQLGRPMTAGPLRELGVGAARSGIDPTKVLRAPADEPIQPAGASRRCTSVDGVFDLNEIVGKRINSVVPVETYLFSSAARSVRLAIHCDDGVRVHANGAFVFASPTGKWLGAAADVTPPIALTPGWNALRLDVVQGSGDWGVSIEVLDAEGGKPAEGISYRATAANAPEPAGVEDRAPLDALRPMAETLNKLNDQYVATPEEKLNDRRRKLAQNLTDQVKKIDRRYGVSLGWGGGNSTPTPCSDGKWVYVWRGETGVLSCYDLEGNCRWQRFQHTGDDAEHGFNSSPIIAGNVIALIGGAKVFGFDRTTGRTLWKQRYPHPCYASLAAARVAGEDVFVTPVGMILRAVDGKVVQKAFGRFDGECASPVLDEDRFYLVARAGFCTGRLPAALGGDLNVEPINRLAPEAIQDMETYPVGSPLCDGGLVYFTHSGWSGHQWPILFVADPTKPGIIYQHRLDLTPEIHYAPDGAGVAASLTLAGKHLYVMANRGETIVCKPGRAFEQEAKNTIESVGRDGRQEITESTPIFDGDRMYYRGEYNLYCISSKP